MKAQVYAHANDLKGFSIKNCPSMPFPANVMMCPPDHYNIAIANSMPPFGGGGANAVDKERAAAQWKALRAAYEAAGKTVKLLSCVEGLSGMVFCSNQALTGLTARMERVCVPSQMRHPSRRREVPYGEAWLRAEGYRVERLSDPTFNFEAQADCRWHPGKRLLWGGYGFRSDPEVYPELAAAFDVPIIRLKMVNEGFSQLDACFCPLTQEAVLIYPPAFAAESLELILKLFPIVLAAEESEAVGLLACNAAVIDSRVALVQKGLGVTTRHMRAVGLEVIELDTSEFIKSGGSLARISMSYF